jgi:hypothetical protein
MGSMLIANNNFGESGAYLVGFPMFRDISLCLVWAMLKNAYIVVVLFDMKEVACEDDWHEKEIESKYARK